MRYPSEIRCFRRPLRGRLELGRVDSRLLRNNPLGDPHERDVLVYLPPSYDASKQPLPLVLLLPAFGSTPWSLVRDDLWTPNLIERIDTMQQEGSAPFVLAIPDATNRWGGSQFIDSPASGPYQSFLVEEVVPWLDHHYRTVSDGSGRAIVGRSSGGFGALRMGLDRPGVFGAAGSHAGDGAFEISLRPMLLEAAVALQLAGGLEAFSKKVSKHGPQSGADHCVCFVLAAASAYERNKVTEWPFFKLPFDPRSGTLREEVWENWLSQDPCRILRSKPEALASMRLVYVDAGDADEHGLQFASRAFVHEMTHAGVRVCYEEFGGGHRGTRMRYLESIPRLVSALVT